MGLLGWGSSGACAGLGRPARVLVLGAGCAGCLVARGCSKLDGVGSVTLVDRKDHLDVAVGAPRALVEPEFGARATPLLSEVFPEQGGKVTVVRVRDIVAAQAGGATVLSHSDGAETVLDGFDVVVVATGSTYGCRFTRNETLVDRAALVASYKETAAHLAREDVGGVLVVGGGITGVEMAGEVATDFPHARVTLVHGGEHLTPAPALGRVSLASLRKLGVDVLLKDRVDDAEDSVGGAPRDYVTRGGKTVPGVTAVIKCGGIQGYNTGFLPAAALDAKGQVRTAPTLLVPALSQQNRPVFACGDCADRCEPRLISAMASAKAVVGAVQEFCRTARVTARANVQNMGNLAAISIGRKEGAATLPFLSLAVNFLGRWAKAKDMMVPFVLKEFGVAFARDVK